MMLSRPIRSILVAIGLGLAAAVVGCDKECGDGVYLVESDIGADGKPLPQTGWVRTYGEKDIITPLDPEGHGVREIRDLRVGEGRFAQATRLMTVSFTASDAAGRELGGGRVRFLYPPIPWNPSQGNRIGRVPDAFSNGLAGMREGGERTFTAPSEKDEYRAFMEHETMRSVYSLPEKGRLTYRVTLEQVCRPEVCIRETYSIPASKSRGFYVKRCD